jgi:glycosyltransferase involved in cell wall biosynthesis
VSVPSLTVVILTHNEILHIERALRCLDGFAARVLVVDSGSSDGTAEAALEMGADVRQRAWVNYADQFQWALDHGDIDTDWVMRLDADEVIGADLAARLAGMLPELPPAVTALSLDRRHLFMGRWIKHGGRWPLRLVRLWRRGLGHIEQRWMDEHIVIRDGEVRHVAGEFSDINLNDLGFFTAKHNGYATREAIDALIGKYGLFELGAEAGLASTRQAEFRRGAKTGFYNRLPLGIGPLGYFFYRYVVQLGFLDGRAGLIYHGLQGLWYRFLVDARRFELERALAGCADNEARIDRLSALTGHDLRGFEAATAPPILSGSAA